jgi:hypothetical protein
MRVTVDGDFSLAVCAERSRDLLHSRRLYGRGEVRGALFMDLSLYPFEVNGLELELELLVLLAGGAGPICGWFSLVTGAYVGEVDIAVAPVLAVVHNAVNRV